MSGEEIREGDCIEFSASGHSLVGTVIFSWGEFIVKHNNPYLIRFPLHETSNRKIITSRIWKRKNHQNIN